MHLTPRKQELTSHLGLLRLGSWVGKLTIPKPLMYRKQQFQQLRKVSTMALSWQALWRGSWNAADQGPLHCTAASCAVAEKTSCWNGSATCCIPRQGKWRLFCEIHMLFLAPQGRLPARLVPALICWWTGEESLKYWPQWPKGLKGDSTRHFSG